MASASRKVDGQEKVIATAQHIVKSLATSKNAADDMIRILSGFDNRLTPMPELFHDLSLSSSAVHAPAPSGLVPSSEPSPMPKPEEEFVSMQETNDVIGSDSHGSGGSRGKFDSLMELAKQVILKWDSSVSSESLVFDSPSDAADYRSAVLSLITVSTAPDSDGIVKSDAETTLQIAMARLEDEFRLLLSRSNDDCDAFLRRLSLSIPSFSSSVGDDFDPSSSSFHEDQDSSTHTPSSAKDQISTYLISSDMIPTLKDIAELMVSAGYSPELSSAYADTRRDVLVSCLATLGLDKMSIEEVQKVDGNTLDGKMKRWIQGLRLVAQGLLTAERAVCDEIFSISDDLRDECFAEATKGCVLQLLNFGDAVAIGKRSSEKLFRILGMYEVLNEMLPILENLFSGEAREFIKEETEGIMIRLGDAVRGTIAEFGNAIQGENSRRALLGGEIHPLTRYVMNYVGLLTDYSGSLNVLLDDGDNAGEGAGEGVKMTPLGRAVHQLVTYLHVKIEEKAKFYEDDGLQYVFLMNNLLYIVQKVKDSGLKTLLGDNWIRKNRGQIRQYSTSYLRTSWSKVLTYLRDDGLSASNSNSSALKTALKERFRNFTLVFEEIYRVQTTWKVPDSQLREELKISVSETVLPAYRSFVGRFHAQLESGRNQSKYIKYTPEDLEAHLADLFEGIQVPNIPKKKLGA